MLFLNAVGAAASFAATAAITGMGVVFFGAWAIAILNGNVK